MIAGGGGDSTDSGVIAQDTKMCACVCRLNDSVIINTFMSSLKCHPLLSFNLLLLSIFNRSLEFTFPSQIIMVRLKCATEGVFFIFTSVCVLFHHSFPSYVLNYILLSHLRLPAPAPCCPCCYQFPDGRTWVVSPFQEKRKSQSSSPVSGM